MIAEKPWTVDEAAAFMGYAKSYLYKLMSQGRVPYYRPTAGRAVFQPDEVRAFMSRGRRSAGYELSERADAMLVRG